MKLIPLAGKLGRGLYATVDDDDYTKLTSMGNWLLLISGRKGQPKPYVRRFDFKTKKWISIHRVVLGVENKETIDHINGDTLDNRKSNLRICTNQQNQYNQKRRVNTKWMRGVTYDKRIKSKPFKAQIKVKGKNYHLGIFATEAEAHETYKQKLLEVAGEFARFD